MRLGTAWHAFMRDVYSWWAAHDSAYPERDGDRCAWCGGTGQIDGEVCAEDCYLCDGTGDGPVAQALAGWATAYDADPAGHWADSREQVLDEAEKLSRMCEGYLRRYGPEPSVRLRVLATELRLSLPILTPDGRPFRPRVPVREDPFSGVIRLARRGDPDGSVRWVRWPWYYVGELDLLMQYRDTGQLVYGEHKSSSDPSGLLQGLAVDPQTAGYELALVHCVRAGHLSDYGVDPDTDVAGFLYDVASTSMQHDPRLNQPKRYTQRERKEDPTLPEFRDAEMSVARNRTVPSWRLLDFARENGIHLGTPELRDYVDFCASQDARLYRRAWDGLPPEDLERTRHELSAVAARLAGMRRDVHRAGTAESIAAAFPRTAVCRIPGGSCGYTGICVRDSPEARTEYDVGLGQTWSVR